MDYERKPGARVIKRFQPIDRYAHWLLAITWVTLAITGLILSIGKAVLLPLIGYTLFSWLAVFAKNLHNFVGPVLIVAVPLMFVRYVRDNGIGIEDFRWFINIIGYFKGHEYPSGKYNAGEKLVFWFVLVLFSTILVISGLVLVFPNFDQTRATMQTANIVHMICAYLAMALACVHVYLGTIGMTGAYRAMRDGYVDESWAEHHHARWYEDVVAGRARETFVQPRPEGAPGDAAVPPMRAATRPDRLRGAAPLLDVHLRHHTAARGGASWTDIGSAARIRAILRETHELQHESPAVGIHRSLGRRHVRPDREGGELSRFPAMVCRRGHPRTHRRHRRGAPHVQASWDRVRNDDAQPEATSHMARRPSRKGAVQAIRRRLAVTDLAVDACKIEFELSYEFAGGLFDKATGGVVERIADQIVDAFARRAENLR